MDIKICLLVLLLTGLFPTSSKAQTVTYNYAQGVNFAEFKTYKWVNIESARATDAALDGSIRAIIDAQLMNKGLTKSQDVAQLLIAYQASIGRECEITTYEESSRYGPGWSYSKYYGYSLGPIFISPALVSTETGSTIRIGDLVLDMYDSGYLDLVWRGRVSQAISFSDDSNKRQQRLNKAASKLLKVYPRKPKAWGANDIVQPNRY